MTFALVMLLAACSGGDDKSTDSDDPNQTDETSDTEATDTENTGETSDTEPTGERSDTESDTEEPAPVLEEGRYLAGTYTITVDSCDLGEIEGFYLDVTATDEGYDMVVPDAFGTFVCTAAGTALTCEGFSFSKGSSVVITYDMEMSGTIVDTTSFVGDHSWIMDCEGDGCAGAGVSFPCDYDFSTTFTAE